MDSEERASRERHTLEHLGETRVEVCCEVGRAELTLAEARRLRVGSVVELPRLAGEAFALYLNGVPFAMGEIAVVKERLNLRVTGFCQEVCP